jgi:hypothetical protein
MSDHFGRLFTLRGVIMLSMIATPMLYLERTHVLIFFALLFVVYYCYGTQLSVYTALAGDFTARSIWRPTTGRCCWRGDSLG